MVDVRLISIDQRLPLGLTQSFPGGVGYSGSPRHMLSAPVTSLGILIAPPAATSESSGVHRQSPSYKMEEPSSGHPTHLSPLITHAS